MAARAPVHAVVGRLSLPSVPSAGDYLFGHSLAARQHFRFGSSFGVLSLIQRQASRHAGRAAFRTRILSASRHDDPWSALSHPLLRGSSLAGFARCRCGVVSPLSLRLGHALIVAGAVICMG